MQTNYNGKIRALGWITLGSTLLLGIFWGLLMAFSRDPGARGFFLSGRAECVIFYILLGLAAATLATWGFLLRGGGGALQEGSPLVFFSAGATALLLLAYCILLFVLRVVQGDAIARVFFLPDALLALPGAAYFLLLILPDGMITTALRRTLIGWTGILGALFFLLHTMAGYFDFSLNMNSPMKAVEQFFFLVAGFFLLMEIGVLFGRRSFALYLPFASATVLLGFLCAVGGFVAFCADGQPLYTTVLHDFLVLAVAFYAMGRLYEQVRAASPRRCAFLDKMAEEAKEKARLEEERREALSRAREEETRRQEEKARVAESRDQQVFDFGATEVIPTVKKEDDGQSEESSS